jgi:hypothetical protein
MALKPLQAQLPFGQFDGYDADVVVGGLKGGEVVTLVPYGLAGTDQVAADGNGADGYTGTAAKYRSIITKTLGAGSRPLFLADEGTSGYGTLFGQLVGAVAGQKTAGAQIGPHTASGSGKVTVWNYPGLYAVTLDAVNTAADGLLPSNAAVWAGKALTATTAGLLSPVGAAAGSFDSNLVVARLVEFGTNGSLVTTPNYLTGTVQAAFTQVVISWTVET